MSAFFSSLTLPNMLFEQPAAAILLPIALGTAVGFTNRPTATQATYMSLKQPPLRPPPQVFGPVWTALYGVMGYASYRAWSTGMSSFNPRVVELTKQGANLYTIQLALNLLWMPLFFKYKKPIAASVDIVALTGVVSYLTYTWSQVDDIAAYAMAPYLAWLGFATYLCIGVGYLNDWDANERPMPPSKKDKRDEYVNEKSK